MENQENKKAETNKTQETAEVKKAAMYTEDRDVITNHLKQSASRLLKAKFPGASKMAMDCLTMASELDEIETEPKPEPKKRKS